VIQESLKKLNVDVTVTQMEWGAFVADNKKSNDSCGKEGSDIYSSANTFRPDPDATSTLLPLEGEINKGSCDTPDPARRPAVEARQSSNHAERKRLYEEIQRIAMQESLGLVVAAAQHRGDVEQAPGLLPVVHRPPALPQEGLARVGTRNRAAGRASL
jgi:ABC-type transport system substrate-binding protein